MSKRNEKRKIQMKWNEEDVKEALKEIKSGKLIRPTAANYGMSEGMLRNRIKMEEKGKALVGSGRRPSLSVEEEKQLASCIGVLCNLGFSPSRAQMKDLVCDYTKIHQLKTPFKDGRPGKNWLRKFMERNKLSMKKANMISAARISATCNPFIIYDFYDTIEGLMTDKQYSAEQVFILCYVYFMLTATSFPGHLTFLISGYR